jgi:hypothetical protein
MEALMKNLFSVAGVALFGHIVFCSALRLRLCDRDDVIRELFAVPNSFITGGVGPRLLRLRYYLPWREPAADSLEGDALSRILLFCASVTGLTVPIAFLAFFIVPFIEMR